MNNSHRRPPRGSPGRSQRGSVYLGYALLAFMIAMAGALLVRVSPKFAWLVPIGVLVFFLPNLMALAAWVQGAQRFRRCLAALPHDRQPAVLVLRNEFRGPAAQALWLDPARRQLGLIAETGAGEALPWEALTAARAVYVPESFATSFHEGRVRIPARFVLVLEFGPRHPVELVTRRRRRLQDWLDALRPHLGDRLDPLIGGSP